MEQRLFNPHEAPLPGTSPVLRDQARKMLILVITAAVFALAALLGPVIYLANSTNATTGDFERLTATALANGSKESSTRVRLSDESEDTLKVTRDVREGDTFDVWRKKDTAELFAEQPRITLTEWIICAVVAAFGLLMVYVAFHSWRQRSQVLGASPDSIRGILRLTTMGVSHVAEGHEQVRVVTVRVEDSSMPTHSPGQELALKMPARVAIGPDELTGELEGWVLTDAANAPLVVRRHGSPTWWTGDRVDPSIYRR